MALVFLSLIITILLGEALSSSDRPVIGILTLPQCNQQYDFGQCIAASYVKYVEAAGARVVPIPYDSDEDDLRRLLSQLNGVLLTGGDTVLQVDTPFFNAVKAIVEFTFESNTDVEPFPLLGICQGFEAIAAAVTEPAILESFDAKNLSLPLQFVSGAEQSNMFPESRPDSVLAYQRLQSKSITFNHHELGISTESFEQKLTPLFRLVAVNNDRQGATFVSAFEGTDAPVFAVQFHPEKHIFEWSSRMDISHEPDAVFANRYFADVFIDAARRSSRQFISRDELDNQLIYNYSPVYTGRQDGYFEQIYFITPQHRNPIPIH